MGKVLIEEQTLTDIGNSIRSKTGLEELLNPMEMSSMIETIDTSGNESIIDYINDRGKILDFPYWREDITKIDAYAFAACHNLSMGDIPVEVTSIGIGAFLNTNVTFTELPNSVEVIDNYAFRNCHDLALTKLPDSLVTLYPEAFQNCENIKITEFPEGLSTISSNSFYGCEGLEKLIIHEGIQTIGNAAFYRCTGLTQVNFKGTPTSIAENAFGGCSNLSTITVPWANGAVAGAPWGATNARVRYNYNYKS